MDWDAIAAAHFAEPEERVAVDIVLKSITECMGIASKHVHLDDDVYKGWVAHLVRPPSAGVEVGDTNSDQPSPGAEGIRVPHLSTSPMRGATRLPADGRSSEH